MSARDELVSAIDAEIPAEAILRLLDAYDAEFRAVVLRAAAEQLETLRHDPETYFLEILGLERAVTVLRAVALEADAAALESQVPESGPPSADELRRKLREYTVSALETAGVPSAADANTARAMLLDNGLKTYATDAELESFQALRRQTRNEVQG